MPRYKIIIEYDGTGFVGWQRQQNDLSIQQAIEESIEKFSGEKITIHAAGRTDAGVHALGQVAHFDLSKSYTTKEIQGAINHFLKPNKVMILTCEEVDEAFHARFSAVKRYYRYEIFNRNTASIFETGRSWHIREKLNIEKMQLGAHYLIGQHDFTSFRTIHCQAYSPIKTLDEILISKQKDKIIILLKAKSFLHHMVRNIVGTLVNVGIEKLQPEDILRILEAKDRKYAAQTAPACGLYFVQVDY